MTGAVEYGIMLTGCGRHASVAGLAEVAGTAEEYGFGSGRVSDHAAHVEHGADSLIVGLGYSLESRVDVLAQRRPVAGQLDGAEHRSVA
jgi:hypothetical protein